MHPRYLVAQRCTTLHKQRGGEAKVGAPQHIPGTRTAEPWQHLRYAANPQLSSLHHSRISHPQHSWLPRHPPAARQSVKSPSLLSRFAARVVLAFSTRSQTGGTAYRHILPEGLISLVTCPHDSMARSEATIIPSVLPLTLEQTWLLN